MEHQKQQQRGIQSGDESFHELNGDRMCKIRRKDFGWKW